MMEKQKYSQFEKIEIFLFCATVIFNNTFGSAKSVYVISKAVMLLFFLVELAALFKRKTIELDRILFVPFLFLVWEFLSLLWSHDLNVSFSQFVTQAQLFCLFLFTYFFVKRLNNVNAFLISLYISGITLGAYALRVYGFNNYLSIMLSGARLGGEITNENVFGMVFAQAAIVAFYYMLESKKPYHLLSILVFTFFALSSGSKKAALLIPMGILLVIILNYGLKKVWKSILLTAVAVFVVYQIIQMPIFGTVFERLTEFFKGKSFSDKERRRYIEIGMRLFYQKPLFGTGLSSFAVLSGLGTYSHNNMVEVLVSLGIIGFVLFYAPIIRYFFSKPIHEGTERLTSIVILTLALTEIIMEVAMVDVYDKSAWLLLGVLLSYHQNEIEGKRLTNAKPV